MKTCEVSKYCNNLACGAQGRGFDFQTGRLFPFRLQSRDNEDCIHTMRPF